MDYNEMPVEVTHYTPEDWTDRYPITAALLLMAGVVLTLLLLFNFDSVLGTVFRWAGLG